MNNYYRGFYTVQKTVGLGFNVSKINNSLVKRIIEYLFEELNIDLLSAFHYPNNDQSKKVLEKCGFEYEITIEQGSTRYDGQVFDAVCYSILNSDYFQNKLL